jgi:hypothetical protein
MNLNLSLCAACGAPYLYLRSILLRNYYCYPLTPMSHSADEGEPSEQELFQDLLAGSEYVLLTPFQSVCFAKYLGMAH